MCTVIFSPHQRGYILGMNRDEKLTRAIALPPSFQNLNGQKAIFPREPGGGTWIAVNDFGISLALINWYSVKLSAGKRAISRGTVINSLIAGKNLDEVSKGFSRLPWSRMNPFRLIGFFPAHHQVIEWRWNRKKLVAKTHAWETGIWISSGFDEPGAQKSREVVFNRALQQKSSGNVAWVRRLLRSHQPLRGPYSICMHREDAATVSYTEIQAGVDRAKMIYTAGPPCSGTVSHEENLNLYLR